MSPSKLPFTSASFTLSAGERTLSFRLPADHEAVLDSITETQYDKDRFLPYWAERWPSSERFFSFLTGYPFPAGAAVCELGSGLGVIASLLAVRNIFMVATDIAVPACRFAAENILCNGGLPRVVAADWRHPPFTRRFDLIIASDILYEERWIDPVLGFISDHLAPGGTALIADPCRRFWQRFKSEADLRGFLRQVVDRGETGDGKGMVEILELKR